MPEKQAFHWCESELERRDHQGEYLAAALSYLAPLAVMVSGEPPKCARAKFFSGKWLIEPDSAVQLLRGRREDAQKVLSLIGTSFDYSVIRSRRKRELIKRQFSTNESQSWIGLRLAVEATRLVIFRFVGPEQYVRTCLLFTQADRESIRKILVLIGVEPLEGELEAIGKIQENLFSPEYMTEIGS